MIWLDSFRWAMRPCARKITRRPTLLRLECLEDRLAPIVGANGVPAAIPPGGQYDGVVYVHPGPETGLAAR